MGGLVIICVWVSYGFLPPYREHTLWTKELPVSNCLSSILETQSGLSVEKEAVRGSPLGKCSDCF